MVFKVACNSEGALRNSLKMLLRFIKESSSEKRILSVS